MRDETLSLLPLGNNGVTVLLVGRLGYFDGIDAALRRLRKNRGLSQDDMHTRTKVARGNISRYETGDKVPELETLSRLLVGANANLHDLADALDDVNERPRQARSIGPVDSLALARLRREFPHAPQELLVQRAAMQQQLDDTINAIERLERLLAAVQGGQT